MAIFSATPVRAEAPFDVQGPTEAPGGDAVSRLQQEAVAQWLERSLGSRYAQVEREITPEFAKKYILDFSVGHPNGSHLVTALTGHLDSDGLKRWVRVADVHSHGRSFKPLFVLSSTVPAMGFTPATTATQVRSNNVAQQIFSESNVVLAKLGARATPASEAKFPFTQPPKTRAEIHSLQEAVIPDGFNAVFWVQLTPSKTQGAVRMDSVIYNLNAPRLVIARTDELPSPDANHLEGTNSAFSQMRADIDGLISDGTLFAVSHALVIQGIDSYQGFSTLGDELGKLDFIDQAIVKRSESKAAEFEVLSSLKDEELYARLQTADLAGIHLKPVRLDAQSLVMRYSR